MEEFAGTVGAVPSLFAGLTLVKYGTLIAAYILLVAVGGCVRSRVKKRAPGRRAVDAMRRANKTRTYGEYDEQF